MRPTMNPTNDTFLRNLASSRVTPARSTNSDGARLFLNSFTTWVNNSLPVIERGIGKWDADPTELVRAFDPWLREALEKLGPDSSVLNVQEYVQLSAVFERAIDALERVYKRSGQSLAVALSLLDGLEELIIV